MDATDHQLIAALRHDARASLSDLALGLGKSRTTIRGRIERLRQRGDILEFSVVLIYSNIFAHCISAKKIFFYFYTVSFSFLLNFSFHTNEK